MNIKQLKTWRQILLVIFMFSLLPGCWLQSSAGRSGQGMVFANQTGFYPNGPKVAIVTGCTSGNFELVNMKTNQTVFSGPLGKPIRSHFSNKVACAADFSSYKEPGTYKIQVHELGESFPFKISDDVHFKLAKASLRAYYYQRASVAILPDYGGEWARNMGHPDMEVAIHASAASTKRPEGIKLASPRGWYDAGDYNKYIVNSGITMGTLLSLYEDFPIFMEKVNVNIPESDNGLPDILDEILWNLRWMQTMQDPNDGGVYHKLTTANFKGMVMPQEEVNTRYLVQKSTAATLDFAAVMAQASRVLRAHQSILPGLADSCIYQAKKAWEWALANPAVFYRQKEMNRLFDPDISTGDYSGNDLIDEFIWAAAELSLTTKDPVYYQRIDFFPDNKTPTPSWRNVRLLAYYSVLRHRKDLFEPMRKDLPKFESAIKKFADNLIDGFKNQYFRTVMGKSERDFVWGSNAVAANQAVGLVQGYLCTGDEKYLKYALMNLDYLLGRNPTGYAYVTGFGSKTPMHPHQRVSESDGIKDPIPGFLVGGPNPGQQDHCDYPSNLPDESYTDLTCSFASNEIAINWNAPLVYVTFALEALQDKIPSN